MRYLVNGQLVSEDRIREEEMRLRSAPRFRTIADGSEQARCLRTAAEIAAIEALLVEQIAAPTRGRSTPQQSHVHV